MEPSQLFSRPLVLCALANFAQSVAFSLFLHFPGLLKDFGAGETEIGVLVALGSLSALIAGPFIGQWMDRLGRLPVIRGGTLLAVVVFFLYLRVDAITPSLYLIRLLHGVAEGMLYAAFFTFAVDHIPEQQRAHGLALFGTSAMLALSIGGLLGDAVIDAGGYPALFTTAALCGMAALLLALPLVESHRRGVAREARPRHLLATLTQPSLVPLWSVAWMYFFAMAGIFAFLKTYVMATGFGTLGAFFAIYTTVAIAQRLLFGWVPDRFGLERVLVPALIAFASGLVLLAIAGEIWHVWLAAMLCGVGHGFSFPILLALVTRRARASERGTAMALFTTIDDGAVLVAGPLLGFLIESSGYAMTFLVAAGSVGAALAAFCLWDRHVR